MTREEAIAILTSRDTHGMLCGYTSGYTDALDMAIEALEELPKRRKEAKRWKHKALQAEPKHGEWLPVEDTSLQTCSECSFCIGIDNEADNYCPHCGAKMDKE